MLRQLRALLWKALLIRKRHWLLTILESMIPTLFFVLIAWARSNMDGLNKIYVNQTKYHDPQTTNNIYSHLDVGSLKLLYAPYDDATEAIIRKVQFKLSIPQDDVTNFMSKDDLLRNTKFEEGSRIAAIIFKEVNESILDYDLTIYDKYLDWNTDKLFKTTSSVNEQKSASYLADGFAALQIAIDTAFMEIHSFNPFENLTFTLQQVPDPPHIENAKLNQLFFTFLPAVTVFSFILLCPSVVKKVNEEKTSGIKEMMKMVGVKSSQIWFSWFVYASGNTLISIAVIVFLMKVPLWGVPYSLIEHSDGTVLFAFLLLYCLAAITFCFLLAHISKNPFLATIFGIVIWLGSYFFPLSLFSSLDSFLWRFKALLGVLPNMALYYGYSSISVYESREIGIQWNNLFEPGSGDDQDITMGQVFIMLFFDTFAFMVLTVYLDNVKPEKYGIPKSPAYPLEAVFKTLRKCFACHKPNDDESLENGTVQLDGTNKIRISNLKKIYSTHVAVEDLDMDIKENSITVLLGENGAGKTTTMSILTGMTKATSGSVIIGGKSMKSDCDELRKSMGLCPQHNLVFHDLTVYEHLYFFATIKGVENIEVKIEKVLEQLGITEKKDCMPHTLSGGTKRKLCLAIALIGNPEVLILDEPTSGMDPESQRKVWSMLSEHKKSKTILMSTHSMEEAEALGDRIALMANGKLQCEGTPTQLKTRYDTGYNLSLCLKSKENIGDIRKTILNFFPSARVKHETEDSVVYFLPFDDGNRYSKLIKDLEEKEDISNITINATTLTDVFLKAKDENDGVVKGTGYRLCVLQRSKESTCKLREILMEDFPKATVLRENDDSLVYFLPQNGNATNTRKIENLMEKLQREKNLDINSVTVNVTTSKIPTLQEQTSATSSLNQNGEYHLCLLLKSKRFINSIERAVKKHFPKSTKLEESKNYVVYALNLAQEQIKISKNLIGTLERKNDDWDIFSINMGLRRPNGVILKFEDDLDEFYKDDGFYLCVRLQTKKFANQIKQTVKKSYPKSKIIDESDSYILFDLPSDDDDNNYSDLTKELEDEKDRWEITEISTDVKEIFDTVIAKSSPQKFHTWHVLVKLIEKRGLVFKGTLPYFVISVLVTMLIFLLAVVLTVSNTNITGNSGPPLNLSLATYGNPKVYHGIHGSNPVTVKLNNLYKQIVLRNEGKPISEQNISRAIVEEALANLAFYKKHMIAAVEFDSSESNHVLLNALYSVEALHGIPISINLAMNTILKFYRENVTIRVRNAPLIALDSQINPSELSVLNVLSIWLMFIPLCFFLFGSLFIAFPHSEVSTNFIKLQANAGVATWLYWFTNLLFDYVLVVFSLGFFFGVLYFLNLFAFHSNGYQNRDIWALAVIFGVYTLTSLPFTYLFSYCKQLSEGITTFLFFGILTGIVPTLIIITLEVLSKDYDKEILDYVRKIFILFSPQFALSNLIAKFLQKYVENFNWRFMEPDKRNHICSRESEAHLHPCCVDPWSVKCEKYESYFRNKSFGIQEDLFIMLGTFGIYLIVLLIKNAPDLMIKITNVKEIKRYLKYIFFFNRYFVEKADKNDVLSVKGLSKVYGRKTIVNNLNFDIKEGSCFGLLGVNGAGKTTTIRMLTKYLISTKGKIGLTSADSKTSHEGMVGYCPQENSLNYKLTGRELLNTMATLKGSSWSIASETTNYLLKKSGLTKHADKVCSQYSGGNKRKLNTCIAFLGFPELTFLDEPTSGVDPSGKRKFWNMLSSFKRRFKSSFLLCSHSMEECENLCDNVGIMINGRFVTNGSPVVLKAEYEKKSSQRETDGNCRNNHRKLKITTNFNENRTSNEIKQDFPKEFKENFKLREEYGTTLIYETGLPLSETFLEMEKLKANNLIENFDINNISLQDVLLQVAQQNNTIETKISQASFSLLSVLQQLRNPFYISHRADH